MMRFAYAISTKKKHVCGIQGYKLTTLVLHYRDWKFRPQFLGVFSYFKITYQRINALSIFSNLLHEYEFGACSQH
jgi:hypothetical protein